jgi:DNA-binding response OmpR family regulator
MVPVFVVGEERLGRRVEKALLDHGFGASRVLPAGLWGRVGAEFPAAAILVGSDALSVEPLLLEGVIRGLPAPIVASEPALGEDRRRELIASGAFDCVRVTPPEQLIARVGRVVRDLAVLLDDFRSGPIMAIGDLRIDPNSTEAYIGSKSLGVNALQFRVLSRLAREPGRAMLSTHLLETVWGKQVRRDAIDQTVGAQVKVIRKLIAAVAPHRGYFHTELTPYGIVYLLEERPASVAMISESKASTGSRHVA